MFKRQKKKTGSNVPPQATVPPMPEMNMTGICQYETPEFRKPTPPLPPTSGSNAVKPNSNYVPLDSVKKSCPYELPCGWCTKWDKKCDKKIGGGDDSKPTRGLRAEGNVYDDNFPIPRDVVGKIIQEVADYEESMNKLKEAAKENNNETN